MKNNLTVRRGGGQGYPVVVDARWLGVGGPGRVTELLLKGLSALGPEAADWIIRGPQRVTELTGLPHELDPSDPRRRRELLLVPDLSRHAPLYIYLHQNRPLAARRNVTLVHDTLQLLGVSRVTRRAMRAYLRSIVFTSAKVVTVSRWAQERIAEDLGLDVERITVLQNPVDPAAAAALRTLRQMSARREVALYVGRFAQHKNIERLLTAFRSTQFRMRFSGQLVLVGGTEAELRAICPRIPDGVRVLGRVSDTDLKSLYAGCRVVIQPSLAEGFGLPVSEALAGGIAVAASAGGALPEVARGFAHLFDPLDADAMGVAIDDAITAGRERTASQEADRALAYLSMTWGPREYASSWCQLVQTILV